MIAILNIFHWMPFAACALSRGTEHHGYVDACVGRGRGDKGRWLAARAHGPARVVL